MKLIALTGPDACGKDTQLKRLENSLLSLGLRVQTLSIHSSMRAFSHVSDPKTINEFLNIFLLQFAPEARSLFLMSLLKNSFDQITEEADILLYNSFWYKYAAAEMTYGIPSDFWTSQMKTFLPKPDLMVRIHADVQSCLLRRSRWSSYESGGARYLKKSPLDLESFQTQLHFNLNQLLSSTEAPQFQVNGQLSEDLVFQQILIGLQDFLVEQKRVRHEETLFS